MKGARRLQKSNRHEHSSPAKDPVRRISHRADLQEVSKRVGASMSLIWSTTQKFSEGNALLKSRRYR